MPRPCTVNVSTVNRSRTRELLNLVVEPASLVGGAVIAVYDSSSVHFCFAIISLRGDSAKCLGRSPQKCSSGDLFRFHLGHRL